MMIVPCGSHISPLIPYLMAFARISASRIYYAASTCCRSTSFLVEFASGVLAISAAQLGHGMRASS